MNLAARSMQQQQLANAPQAAAAPSLRSAAVRVHCVQPPRALRRAPRAAVHTAAALGGREGEASLPRHLWLAPAHAGHPAHLRPWHALEHLCAHNGVHWRAQHDAHSMAGGACRRLGAGPAKRRRLEQRQGHRRCRGHRTEDGYRCVCMRSGRSLCGHGCACPWAGSFRMLCPPGRCPRRQCLRRAHVRVYGFFFRMPEP